MQTLKTAAIVVLLMTVMYGAYVSLTTPPEPLPAEVQTMLDFGDENSLAIDNGLPETLGELEINRDVKSGSTLPSSPSAASSPFGLASVELPRRGSGESSQGGSAPGSFDAPFAEPSASDLAVTGDHAFDSGVNTRFSDADVPSTELPATAGLSFPASTPFEASGSVPSAASGATLDPRGNEIALVPGDYPDTGRSFDLPDPNEVVSSLSAISGQPAAGSDQSGRDLGDATQNLALASGTSDPRSFETPPRSGDVQTAEMSASGSANLGLANAIRTADKQYLEDKRRDALATLSIFYNTPNLSGEQRSELLARLDPLAREVIYSRRHLLEQAHRVGQNETLVDIAQKYEVPWQLLANINQVRDPMTILPGTELKVVRGPFRAEVNLALKELTLFLGDLYAGRFPIGIGSDPAPKVGTYTIQDKQTSKTYYDHAGSPVPPGSPGNPYGNMWLDLGSQLCIHGSPSTTAPTDRGCISLAADYADDLYGILSQGSTVTIRR